MLGASLIASSAYRTHTTKLSHAEVKEREREKDRQKKEKKKKRERRERETDRQRDSGKEGRPAATRGKGGRPEGRRRGGREGVHSRPAPACSDEDFVTLAHTEGSGARREARAPADPPRTETRRRERREPQREHTRPRQKPPRQNSKETNQQITKNKPPKEANKRRTNDKQTRKPNIERPQNFSEFQIPTAKRERKQGAPNEKSHDASTEKTPQENSKNPISGMAQILNKHPQKGQDRQRKTSFPGKKREIQKKNLSKSVAKHRGVKQKIP